MNAALKRLLRPLTKDELQHVLLFFEEMQETVIPQIEEDVRERELLAIESRQRLVL